MHPTQEALEAALIDNPDDLATHSAYADFLSQQGDPRGEFIQVQLRLEDATVGVQERTTLRQREQALLDKHIQDWLGPLYPDLLRQSSDPFARPPEFRFSKGWLDSLFVPVLRVDLARTFVKAADRLRLLRRLTIDDAFVDDDDVKAMNPAEVLAEIPSLPTLAEFSYREALDSFRMNQHFWPREMPVDRRPDNMNGLLEKMPNLTSLSTESALLDMKRLFAQQISPRLRILKVRSRAVYPLQELADNPAVAGLTGLHLDALPFARMDESPTAYLPFEPLRALLESKHFGNLTHLRIGPSDLGDMGCRLLIDSGLLKRLRLLDLSDGTITDAGAQMFAYSPDAKRLELLRLSRNRLTEVGRRLLELAGISADASDQFSDDFNEPQSHLYDSIME